MRLDLDTPTIALDEGQVLTLADAAGIRIQARSGVVWVTEEGEPRDHIVNAGEALVVARPGLTVVQALSPACVALRDSARAANDEVHEGFDAAAYLDEIRHRALSRYY